MIVMTSMTELESLFVPLFDEYFNGENQVVSKYSDVTTADASDKRQQQPDSTSSTSTLATIVTADGNFDLYIFREFRSSRKHFKALSLDESRSPDFDLFSDQEEYSEEEVTKIMAETMEQYMRKTRADYGSGVARPKIEDKDNFELKG
ncbi:hypothetical protein Tco_0215004 [Tanacetum coccineum]